MAKHTHAGPGSSGRRISRAGRRLASGAAILSAGALILSGCAGGGGGGSKPADSSKDVVNLVTPAQPESLDPQISTDSIMGEITLPVFETLVTIDKDRKVQPMLAESFESSADGKEFTFKLRQGVKFQDGSDLDATDVVDSMNRWTRVSIAAQEAFSGAEWTKVDNYTVKLTVPSASFLHLLYLSQVLTAYPAILPSEVIERVGDNPIEELEDLVGTGPYKIKEFKTNDVVVYEANPEYRDAAKPAFATVTLKGGGDSAAATRAVMQDPDTQRMFKDAQLVPVVSTPTQTAQMLDAYRAQWAPVVKKSGYQP